MNKGKRLIFCKECKRKRFFIRESLPDYNFKWTCSKGHSWVEVGTTANRINAMTIEQLLPKIKDLFNRDNAFYRTLKRK